MVHVVYDPKKFDDITRYLGQFGPLAHFEGPAPPDCGAPFVESLIAVPATLEFYFARKLQTSGLVARAYPEELPKSPPFQEMSVKDLDLILQAENGKQPGDNDGHIRTIFETELRKFLEAKRPRFNVPWEITSRDSGMRLAYRWQVVGAAISTCEPSGWEKFDIVVAFLPGEGPEVMLSVLSGNEAPGSFSERPSDARFKDNALSDEQLSNIQDSFHDFLIRDDVGRKDKATLNNFSACPL